MIENLNNAYDEFADYLFFSPEENPQLIIMYKHLNMAKVELNHIKSCECCDIAIEEMATPVIIKSIDLITQYQEMITLQYKYGDTDRGKTNNHSNDTGNSTRICWSGSSTELVELVYAMIETRSFNSGNMKINELLKIFCQTFNCDVKDCYRIYTDISRRKGSKTIYLNRLKTALKERIERELE